MKKRLLILLALLCAVPVMAQQQISGGNVQVTGNGNTAFVTAGNSMQVDVKSVNGTTVSGMVAGSVPVTIVSGAGSGGTALADEGAFTLGTTSDTPIGCYFQTTVTTGALTSGQQGIAQCDANRRLFVVGAGTAGTAAGGVVSVQGVASMTPLEVSPTTAANTLSNQFFTQITDGTHGVTLNSSTYTAKFGLDSNILGLDGAVFSATNALFGEITDGTNAMGAMTNFGVTPTGVKSLNANVSLFQGTTLVGSGAPLQVTGANGTFPLAASSAVIGKTTPVTACGTTAFNQAWQALTTSPAVATSTTTCVSSMQFCNTSSSTAYTVTVTDDQGSPITVIPATSIPPASCYTYPFNYTEFTSGIKWSASNVAVTGAITGVQ